MRIMTPMKPILDRSRHGLTTVAISAVDLWGTDGNWAAVGQRRVGRHVRRQEELVRNVLEVKRMSEGVMSLKLDNEGEMFNVVCGYGYGM